MSRLEGRSKLGTTSQAEIRNTYGNARGRAHRIRSKGFIDKRTTFGKDQFPLKKLDPSLLDESPIDFDEVYENRKSVLSSFCHSTDGLKSFNPPSTGNKHFDNEVKRFIDCLVTYDEVVGTKCIDVETIFLGCLSEGPKFAKDLKKYKEHTILDSCALNMMGNIDYDYVLEGFGGYDSIFDVRFLINFKEEVDDYLWSLIPDGEVPADFAEEFRRFIQSNKDVVPIKARIPLTSSFTFKESVKIKGAKFSKKGLSSHVSVQANTGFVQTNPENLHLMRRVIQVSAGNCRDTVVCDPTELHVVKDFNRVTQLIEDKIKNTVPRDARSSNRISKILEYDGYKIMLDIKKCGLTFPKNMMEVMIDIFIEEYPEYENELRAGKAIIRNKVYMDNDTYIEPTRGYCLGLANNMPTILQAFIFNRWKQKYDIEVYDALFFNDDSILAISRKELGKFNMNLEHFSSFMLNTLYDEFSRYNLIMKYVVLMDTDCYFLEEYHFENHSDTKDILRDLLMVNARHKASYEHAQRYVLCVFDEFGLGSMEQFEKLPKIYGTYISQKEYYLPEELGGWLNTHSNGENISMKIIQRYAKDEGMAEFIADILEIREGNFWKEDIQDIKFEKILPNSYETGKDRKSDITIRRMTDKYREEVLDKLHALCDRDKFRDISDIYSYERNILNKSNCPKLFTIKEEWGGDYG